MPECLDMKRNRISFCKEDRVVAPADAFWSDLPREPEEIFQHLFFVWDMWLDLFPVGSDGDEPESFKRSKKLQILEHGGWIFRAEDHRVDDVRRELVACDLHRIVGVAHEDEALFDAVIEPFAVESRDVRPAAGI